jgi:hypothetical protein
MRWAGHFARIWEKNAYGILARKPKENRPL